MHSTTYTTLGALLLAVSCGGDETSAPTPIASATASSAGAGGGSAQSSTTSSTNGSGGSGGCMPCSLCECKCAGAFIQKVTMGADCSVLNGKPCSLGGAGGAGGAATGTFSECGQPQTTCCS